MLSANVEVVSMSWCHYHDALVRGDTTHYV